MPIQLTGLRVFIATPGGLDAERQVFHSTLNDFNTKNAPDRGFLFIPQYWEIVPSGVGRPQSLINKQVRQSDYLVLIIWDRWGSSTGTDSQYSSGAYEEYVVALECLADDNLPMRDISVLFKAVDERGISDPGPQLRMVITFKEALEEQKQLLFQTFDTESELKSLLEARLTKWTVDFEPKKQARNVDPVTIGEEEPQEPAPSPGELLERATASEGQGHIAQAEAAYASAIVSEDPSAMTRYAQFLRRTGRLSRSYDVNKEVLSQDNVVLDDSPEGRLFRSEILSNMGLIKRKQGELTESLRLLKEGVDTARETGEHGSDQLAYALENLGLTLKHHGDLGQARAAHDEALEIRRAIEDEVGAAKSEINLARLLNAVGEGEAAMEHARSAVKVLDRGEADRHLANALVALGELLADVEELEEAEQRLRGALDINTSLGHSIGIAVASGQLASVLLEMGRPDKADQFAKQCLEENEKSNNTQGRAVALRILGRVRLEQASYDDARGLLEQSVSILARQHDPIGEAKARKWLADTLVQLGDIEEARLQLQSAIRISEPVGDASLLNELLVRFSKLQ